MKGSKELVELGKRVAELRNAKGLTQANLGSMMGKDASSIGRVELGNTNPTYTYLRELAKALEIPLEELIKGL